MVVSEVAHGLEPLQGIVSTYVPQCLCYYTFKQAVNSFTASSIPYNKKEPLILAAG